MPYAERKDSDYPAVQPFILVKVFPCHIHLAMNIGKPLRTGQSGPLHNGLNLNAQEFRSLLLYQFYPITFQNRSDHVFIYPRYAAKVHHCPLFNVVMFFFCIFFSSFI